MPQLTDAQWAEIRQVWETTVGTKNGKARDLGAEYEIHPNTIQMRARREGWHNPEDGEEEAIAEIREAVAEVAPDWMDTEAKSQMERRILELERELAASNAKVEQLRPDTDVYERLFDSVEDVIEWLGEDKITEIAMSEMADVNRQRVRRGHPGLTKEEMQPTAEQIQAEARKILAERRSGVGGPPYRRVIKMVKPVYDGCAGYDQYTNTPLACYRHGSLVQIPMEAQVNNMRMSMFDATQRYVVKGFKMTNPLICMAGPCWEPAAVGRDGKPIHRGYCSEAHYKGTPAEHQESVLNAITTQTVTA